jgi:hypothetical protein
VPTILTDAAHATFINTFRCRPEHQEPTTTKASPGPTTMRPPLDIENLGYLLR